MSRTTSPVTHVLDVAVKRQSSKGVTTRSLEEIGNISNKVPARITAAKLKIIVLDDEKNFVLRI